MKITILSGIVPIEEKNGSSPVYQRGAVVDVAKSVADRLVRDGHAARGVVDLAAGAGQPAPEPEPEPEPAPETPSPQQEAPAPEADATPAAEDSAGTTEAPDASALDEAAAAAAQAEELERPRPTSPVAEWRAYAVSQGHDPDEAADATRADLIALYG